MFRNEKIGTYGDTRRVIAAALKVEQGEVSS